MRTGQYDGVSASGDATLRLIAGGDVAPVNTDLIPNYADVYEGLKDKPHNSVDGQMYGVPHGRGANLLMYALGQGRARLRTPGGSSSTRLRWSPTRARSPRTTSPIYIADAALYLKATQPDLGIDNVYELDDKQFARGDRPAQDAARVHRRVLVGLHQGAGRLHAGRLGRRDHLAGDRQPARGRQGQVSIDDTLPKEGATGWSDTWMIASKAKNPNCMYKWMDHIISPKANAAVAEWFGEAPSNAKSCAETAAKDHCEIFHADDEEYFDQIAYWTTPTADCGDDRGAVCKDYSEWVAAWTEVKG